MISSKDGNDRYTEKNEKKNIITLLHWKNTEQVN